MIEITRLTDRITVKGHAGYAPVGQDIVCAGISALFIGLVESLGELTEDTVRYDIKPGDAWIEYKAPSDELSILIGAFFIGVKTIADTYPECVAVCGYYDGVGSECAGERTEDYD